MHAVQTFRRIVEIRRAPMQEPILKHDGSSFRRRWPRRAYYCLTSRRRLLPFLSCAFTATVQAISPSASAIVGRPLCRRRRRSAGRRRRISASRDVIEPLPVGRPHARASIIYLIFSATGRQPAKRSADDAAAHFHLGG